MKKYVVIGSNSFSGSNFIRHLLEQGTEVMGISRSSESSSLFLSYSGIKVDNFKFKQLDLNQSLNEIIEAVGDFRPDYVVNFAAQGMVSQSWEAPGDWFQTNTVGTIKLHDGLRKFDWLERYVHISTPEVYGSCKGMLRSHPFNP
jgi:dTDP-glucose 4,6-dehydratase